jgi:hypothetical protein
MCVYCGLPVLTDDENEHPGHVVVDYLGATPDLARRGLPGLVLLHRFCDEVLRTRGERVAAGDAVSLRRAHLGWVTEQYDTGSSRGHYDELGLHSPPPRGFAIYQRHWRVRKMRYACKACRYYAGWFRTEWS